jgi:hypothetical protein
MGVDKPEIIPAAGSAEYRAYRARQRELLEKVSVVNEASLRRISQLLTPRQQEQWRQMRGKQIDTKRLKQEVAEGVEAKVRQAGPPSTDQPGG